ncbi:hypothetical protein GE118_02105 [Mycoplasma sp. NEAQ87857]|uniref:hypothetical protein n=1 Tax=Mycoplasma sp. NEAQ87857 TaxID=2683967 RepID=UPI0013181EE3|nr:hypothetical protein [Mycoplasma sp. NEAQ87857]QGZ97588.1 hypothetical protein GE118_02105 [Mycoplasma sp. NEAQ87857]
MKKLLITNLLIIAPALVSCNTINQTKQITKQENKLDEIVKLTLDNNLANQYRQNQLNTSDEYLTELHSSMVLAPIFNVELLDKTTNRLSRTKDAIAILNTAIVDNWYFLLHNLNKLFFIFNPYDSSLNEDANQETFYNPKQLFIQKQDQEQPLVLNLNNKQINNFIIKDLDDKHQIIYLNINDQYMTFLIKQADKLTWLPEIIKLNNQKFTNDFIQIFNDQFLKQYQQIIQKEINYHKLIESSITEEKIKSNFAFDQYFLLFKNNNYVNSLINTINHLNHNNQINLERYTLGGINEN